jgi:hypothetical protein
MTQIPKNIEKKLKEDIEQYFQRRVNFNISVEDLHWAAKHAFSLHPSTEWVSVETGLFPKEGQRVLIRSMYLSGKAFTDIAIYTYGGVHEFDDEDDDFSNCFDEKAGVSFLPKGFWATDADEEKCYERKATHWMPLPPAPPSKP